MGYYFKVFYSFIVICVWVFCLNVHVIKFVLVPVEPEEGTEPLGTRVIDNCELAFGC